MPNSISDNRALALEWRNTVVDTRSWRRANNQLGGSPGESEGFYVVTKGFPRRGYLKPGKLLPDAAQKCRAAREKIAADLACDLDLPVPPCVLWRRNGIASNEGGCVAITLVEFAAEIPWDAVATREATDHPAAELALARVFSECSAMLAFDTWLDHDEHGDSRPANIVWGYNPDQPSASRILFLDYATAMGADGTWGAGQWRSVQEARFPSILLKTLDMTQLDEALDKILRLDSVRVESIVHRIPDDFLPPAQKLVLTQGLLGRRKLLSDVLHRRAKA